MDSNDYGTVTFEGKEYTLTEQAYVDTDFSNGGKVDRYYAHAVDNQGNKYTVVWNTTKEWDVATKDYKTTGEVNGYIEDESNACDWDSPVDVRTI